MELLLIKPKYSKDYVLAVSDKKNIKIQNSTFALLVFYKLEFRKASGNE